ncbi:hypothetical protein STANM309S_05043 [Streptomyces tanashiensis]
MRHVAAGALRGAVLRLLAVRAGLLGLLRVAVGRLLRRDALRGLLGVSVTRLRSLRLAVRARLLRLLAVRARLAVRTGLLAAVRARLVVAHRQVPLTGCLCLPNILAEPRAGKCGGGHTVTEPKRFRTEPQHP